jgi:predicted ribosomally synthesized peptide with nif11-like leader
MDIFMAKEQAEQFLQKMAVDPEIQTKIKAGYRRLLCDIARKEGFAFSEEELQQAFLDKHDLLTDDVLEKATGGIGVCNTTAGNSLRFGNGAVNTTADNSLPFCILLD